MPLYEYLCENCGDVFEVIQKFSDPELTVHEKCQGKVHRLISTSALQFKGSGWYVNDYAKGSGSGSGNGGSSSKDSAKDSGKESSSGGSSSSSDSKPSASTSSPASSSSDKNS